MDAQRQILRDTAEFKLFERIVLTMRSEREPASCIVTDAASAAHIKRAVYGAARAVGMPPPPVLAIRELAACKSQASAILVVASLVAEQNLYEEVCAACPSLERDRIYRLWSDLYVNKVARLFPVKEPTAAQLYTHMAEAPAIELSATTCYALVCTPRSGSTMLANRLMQLGYAGFPREHLREGMLTLAENTDFDLKHWMEAVVTNDSTPNDIFGTKLVSQLLIRLATLFSQDDSANLTRYGDMDWRILRLHRRDRAAQALSRYLSYESRVYFERNDSKRHQRKKFLESLEYNYEAILHHYNKLASDDRKVDEILARLSLPRIDVFYEDVLSDPTHELRRVLTFLGIEPSDDFTAPEPTTNKLDDSLSKPFYDRFRADLEALSGDK